MSAVTSVLGRAKLLTAATVTAAAFLAFPAAAAHATSVTPYPVPSSPGTVNTSVIGANGEVQFGGSGFVPGEAIVITVKPATTAHAVTASNALAPHIQLIALSAAGAPPATPTTIKADKTGSFRAAVRLTTAGTFLLTATGQKSAHVVTATVKVVGGGKGGVTAGDGSTGTLGKGGLSFTGPRMDFAIATWLGVMAIGLGIAFLKIGATRRREAAGQPTI